ncbi:hypothetical protein TWF970_001238 [Orbilia oligospora]|uniref:Uncharacterized protein n=1 Tax=Orbilia oligospora TaxID=2813651 RepID=A0A7C8VHS1_ORBOL|nr:hypothetical protein TWF970_001238 [Orbilia oligospora]
MQRGQKQHTDFQGLKSRLFLMIDFLADAEAFFLNPDSYSKGLQELCPVAGLLEPDDGIYSAPCDTAENQWDEFEYPFCSGHSTPYAYRMANHGTLPQYPDFFEMQPETNSCSHQANRNLPGIAEILNAEQQHWEGQSNTCQHNMVLEGAGTPFCLSNPAPVVERIVYPPNEIPMLQSERFRQTLEISDNPSFVKGSCEIVFGTEPPGRLPPGPQIKLEQQDFVQGQVYNNGPQNYQRFSVNRAQGPQYQKRVSELRSNEATVPTPMPIQFHCSTACNCANPHRYPSQT